MARISGVDLPREKRIEIALTYIYGIGRTTADEIINATGINPDVRVKDLTEEDIGKLRDYIDHNLKVEGDLRREVSLLSRPSPPSWSPRARPEHQAERPYPQGPEEAGCR